MVMNSGIVNIPPFRPIYIRSILDELARRHNEIGLAGNIIRLKRHGLDNCEKYDPTFQRDFKY